MLRIILLRTLKSLPKIRTSRIKWRNYFGTTTLGGIIHTYDLTEHADNGDNDEVKQTLNFEDEIKKVATQGEKYISQLVLVLRTLILQTSIEYQENLIKQIEITKSKRYEELKDELIKYEALASSIAKIFQLESTTALDTRSQMVVDQLTNELMKLQHLFQEQLEEIRRYESELLSANRDSILHGYYLVRISENSAKKQLQAREVMLRAITSTWHQASHSGYKQVS